MNSIVNLKTLFVRRPVLALLALSILVMAGAAMRQASAEEIQYVYDSLNRLVEVRYSDKIIRYTYDDAGNRTSEQVITLNPIPTLTSLDPNGGTMGGGGFTLTVNGTNFVNGAAVNWNGNPRTTAFVNDTRVTATIPAADLATGGTASITVVNPEPGGGASNALPFAINAPASLQFSAATYSVNENGGIATITVTRTGNTGPAVSVNYATSNGTATAGDYTPASGTLSFAAGAISQTFTVPITDDNIFEGDETVNLALSNPSAGAVLGTPNPAVLTIVDNETQPTLSINDVAVSEGNSGTTPANFTVSLSGPSAQSVTVQYATANGTATAGQDYQAITTPQTLTIPAGQTSGTVTVNVIGDTLDEPNETFLVNLTAPTNATIADNQGVGTINDDDPPPSLSINDVAVTEGNTGTTTATFTVSLSAASGQSVTVNYATANGTATAGSDYVAASGTLTFNPGETTKPVAVTVNGDILNEANETFFVNLTNPANATISDNQGQGTINNDDPQPTLAISDVTVTEGNSGTVNANFTVSLSAASGQTVTVNYATADGTAMAGSDYTAISNTLTFNPGDLTKSIIVPVNGDTLDEADETFLVNLTNPANATLSDNQGLGTITDDDPLPALSINDISVVEGNSGTTNAVFTVTLTPVSGRAVTVNYATADGTATVAGSDYQAANGTLTFNAGQTTQTITVLVNGDTLNEASETFFVNLTAPGNATISDNQGMGTITNDDSGVPLLNINDVTVTEGNSGNVAANFIVSLSTASGQTVTVQYATSNGTAIAGQDYQAASSTVTFAPGDTSKPVTVNVIGDTLDEDDETFNVTLSNPTNAQIGDGAGLGTITDDDASPTLSINNTAVTEGNSGTVTATLNVTLSAVSGRNVTVNYATANGTATAGSDYQPASGTLTFSPGQTTTQPVNVTVNGDTEVESDETLSVNLSNPAGATLNNASGQVTITNDDTGVRFSAATYQANEGATLATVTVQRAGLTGTAFAVDYASSDGAAFAECSASNGLASQRCDYTAASGTLSFAAGETSKTFNVVINDDYYVEANENLTLTLSNPTNGASLGANSSAVLTITDNDTEPQPAGMYLARLSGAQEVPAVATNAAGFGTVLLNAAENQITVNMTFTGLSSSQTAAHIHGAAPVETNAPVLFNLGTGAIANATFSVTPAQVAQLKAGLFYFNVHTANNPNGEIRGQILPNPAESARFFVRQQYADFLSREPDQAGWDFWTGQIATVAGADLNLIRQRRIAVSNAFFFELEYQQTGAYTYRLYREAFGNTQPFPNPMGDMDANPYCTANPNNCQLIRAAHVPSYAKFSSDRARLDAGNLAATQLALATNFANQPEFVGRYPVSQTAEQFVDALLSNIQAASGANLTSQRAALIALFNSGGRGAVLFRLAEDNATGNPINNRPFIDAEYNKAFVTTQYFGYLRRDADLPGLNFWLSVVNQFPLRSATGQNGMVCAFITSAEYQQRFGAVSPRANSECQ